MAKPLSILIVEDSEDDLFLLLHELRKGGYEPDYVSVCTADAMRRALTERQWDVITSDYNMPGFSALAALRLQQESGLDLPFIVVSGKIGEDQAVVLMRLVQALLDLQIAAHPQTRTDPSNPRPRTIVPTTPRYWRRGRLHRMPGVLPH